MRTGLPIALLASAIAGYANAQEDDRWVVVGETTDNTIWYIDRSDYLKGRPNQTSASMWVKLDHSRDSTTEFRESVVRYTVNCTSTTFRLDGGVRRRSNGSNVNLPKSYTFDYAVPETVLESAIKMLCASPEE